MSHTSWHRLTLGGATIGSAVRITRRLQRRSPRRAARPGSLDRRSDTTPSNASASFSRGSSSAHRLTPELGPPPRRAVTRSTRPRRPPAWATAADLSTCRSGRRPRTPGHSGQCTLNRTGAGRARRWSHGAGLIDSRWCHLADGRHRSALSCSGLLNHLRVDGDTKPTGSQSNCTRQAPGFVRAGSGTPRDRGAGAQPRRALRELGEGVPSATANPPAPAWVARR